MCEQCAVARTLGAFFRSRRTWLEKQFWPKPTSHKQRHASLKCASTKRKRSEVAVQKSAQIYLGVPVSVEFVDEFAHYSCISTETLSQIASALNLQKVLDILSVPESYPAGDPERAIYCSRTLNLRSIKAIGTWVGGLTLWLRKCSIFLQTLMGNFSSYTI